MNVKQLMALACLAACGACTGAAPAPSAAAGVAETVRLKFAAFDRHDAAAIQDIYGTDAVLHSPDHPELKGNRPIADSYRDIFSYVPDAKDQVQIFDVIGDKVFVQFLMTGHLGGASDKPVHAAIMTIYTVRDGHIVTDDTYYDRKAP